MTGATDPAILARVAELITVLKGTARASLGLWPRDPRWAPPPDSPAAIELQSMNAGPTGAWKSDPVRDAQHWARLIVFAATDHMDSVAALFSSHVESIFGGSVMSRVAVEASAMA